MIDEFVGDIYEGDPEDVIVANHDDTQDMVLNKDLLSFVSSPQRDVAETLEWYKAHADSPPFDPDGMCLKVCRTARNIGAKYASAKEAQDATPTENRIYQIADIRKGMIAYFDTEGDSNPFGHIVTVAGRDKSEDPATLHSLIVWTNSVLSNKLVAVRGDYFTKHWGDKFQFAATWLNGQELIFPKPAQLVVPPKPVELDTKRVHFMLTPLEVFDTPGQIQSDVENIFARAMRRSVDVVIGTEAFGSKVLDPLRRQAGIHGYVFAHQAGNDSWIAVRRRFINGGWRVHWEKIVEGGKEHRDLGVFAVEFRNDDLGRIAVIGNHLLKKSVDGSAAKNLKVTQAIGRYAEVAGAGGKKVFLGSDQNMNDRTLDTFMGVDFTSLGDELGKHESTTEHGRPIDVLATWDPDRMVKAAYLRVLDDSEFKLFGDHFVVEGGADVKFVVR